MKLSNDGSSMLASGQHINIHYYSTMKSTALRKGAARIERLTCICKLLLHRTKRTPTLHLHKLGQHNANANGMLAHADR
jgi:hypothetical protein